MISSIGSPIQAYYAQKISDSQTLKQGKKAPSEALSNQKVDNSKIRSLRDHFIERTNSVEGNTEDAEELLRDFSRPEGGGIFYAVGEDDLHTMNPNTMRKRDRISQLYNAENKIVENQKSELIAEGRAMGKTAQEILNDIVSLYDSQSEFFKLGKGWNGEIFSFDSSSSIGYSYMQKYASDVIEIQA